MRKKITCSKNQKHYSIIKDYTDLSGKRTTKIVENLGNQNEIEERFGKIDTLKKVDEYIKTLEEKEIIQHTFNTGKRIPMNQKVSFNCGYLFLQKIYYSLGIDKICNDIASKNKFTFDLNEVMSNLIYARIICPSSKLSSYESCKSFLENPKCQLQHFYRGLDYIAKNFDFIQKALFNNSKNILNRDYRVYYYDVTNFFFYTEENDFQRYGCGKDGKSLPLVQMGLFMDADGLPISINIHPGNTSEQKTLIGAEEKIINEYNLKGKNIIVCTDAGLASDDNKIFNVKDGRGFIVTQSIKKLKQETKEWVMDQSGWRILGKLDKTYNLKEINESDELRKKYFETIFYKETEYDTDRVKQALIVTFSFKYADYHKKIRDKQIERAEKIINSNEKKKKGINQNDPRRFIRATHYTKNGEVAENADYKIDEKQILEEAKYDGLYGVTTNLIDETEKVIKVCKGRWEIEESFRIFKDDFDSGTVHLSLEERIKAHFITCFLSLFIYRVLEKKLNYKYTTFQILNCLKSMNLHELKGEGYIPSYERTELTDDLHEVFGLNTDTELIPYKKIKIFLR